MKNESRKIILKEVRELIDKLAIRDDDRSEFDHVFKTWFESEETYKAGHSEIYVSTNRVRKKQEGK